MRQFACSPSPKNTFRGATAKPRCQASVSTRRPKSSYDPKVPTTLCTNGGGDHRSGFDGGTADLIASEGTGDFSSPPVLARVRFISNTRGITNKGSSRQAGISGNGSSAHSGETDLVLLGVFCSIMDRF